MTRDELIGIAVDATNDAELKSSEIPAIDLYVDQIINLISGKLAEGSERYRGRQLTKTMINNYSKDGIIMPIKGKKYTREQVIQILCIYSLKNTLSINEIKRLLYGAYSISDFGADELVALYDSHEEIKGETRELCMRLLNDDIIDNLSLDPSDEADYISIICALVSMSAHLKNIAQALIETKFPEPVNDEETDKGSKEKKEKDKDKDKEKKKEDKKEKKEKDKKEEADKQQ